MKKHFDFWLLVITVPMLVALSYMQWFYSVIAFVGVATTIYLRFEEHCFKWFEKEWRKNHE